jgi:hypothetical protein
MVRFVLRTEVKGQLRLAIFNIRAAAHTIKLFKAGEWGF